MAGVKVVQLQPQELVLTDKSDAFEIMRAVMELSRGHSESRMKSVRTLANWAGLVQLARDGGRPITRRLPAWVEWQGAVLTLHVARAVVVKRIFALAVSGYGMTAIVKRLTAEGVPPFGDRVLVTDEDGDSYWEAAPGTPFGCGAWRTSYVRSILRDRRALGEFQPRAYPSGAKRGEPIADYFPRVVSDADFLKARAAVGGRTNKGSANGALANRRGRPGEGVANLFGGLLRHARDGGTYYVAQRVEKGVPVRMLLNQTGTEGKGRAYTFPYATFERALLTCLREIDPASMAPAAPVTPVSVLQGELDELVKEKGELAVALAAARVGSTVWKALAARAEALDGREGELRLRVDECAEFVAAPPRDAARAVHTLIDALDAAEDKEDVRIRLRAALRRIVARVHVLVVPRGRERLLAAQLDFADGGRRSYLVRRVGTLDGARCGTEVRRFPGWWQVRSWTLAEARAAFVPEQPDLAIPQGRDCDTDADGRQEWLPGWQDMEGFLTALAKDDLDNLVFGACTRHPLP
jgi:hypothetical protein